MDMNGINDDSRFKVPFPVNNGNLINKRKETVWNYTTNDDSKMMRTSCDWLKMLLNSATRMFQTNPPFLENLYKGLANYINESMNSEYDRSFQSTSIYFNGPNVTSCESIGGMANQQLSNTNQDAANYTMQRMFNDIHQHQISNFLPLTNINNHNPPSHNEEQIPDCRPFSRANSTITSSEQVAQSTFNNIANVGKNSEIVKDFAKSYNGYLNNPVKKRNILKDTALAQPKKDTHKENVPAYESTPINVNNISSLFNDSDFVEVRTKTKRTSKRYPNLKDTKKQMCKKHLEETFRNDLEESIFNPFNESVLNNSKMISPASGIMNKKLNSSVVCIKQIFEVKEWYLKRKDNSNNIELFGRVLQTSNKLNPLCQLGVVLCRTSKRQVRTRTGQFILMGPMKANSEIHPKVREYFTDGLPVQWRRLLLFSEKS